MVAHIESESHVREEVLLRGTSLTERKTHLPSGRRIRHSERLKGPVIGTAEASQQASDLLAEDHPSQYQVSIRHRPSFAVLVGV